MIEAVDTLCEAGVRYNKQLLMVPDPDLDNLQSDLSGNLDELTLLNVEYEEIILINSPHL